VGASCGVARGTMRLRAAGGVGVSDGAEAAVGSGGLAMPWLPDSALGG